MTAKRWRRIGGALLGLALLTAAAPAQCLQNPNFDLGPTGWNLTSGGTSGTARVLGGFLELSVSFPSDYAQARQRCTSTAFERTVEVDVFNLSPGIDVTLFEIGWENEAGTAGDYVVVTAVGTASATTTNPDFDHVVFRADGDPNRLGASAQGLDNVRVMEVSAPTPTELIDYLLGSGSEPANADVNDDGQTDVADIVKAINLGTTP